jgi:hypothetical protein
MGSSGPAKVDALVVNQLRSAAASLALALIALAVGPPVACGEDLHRGVSSSCYAVLPTTATGAHILLDCNGNQHSIPTGVYVWDFAIDQEGSALALKRPVLQPGWLHIVTFDFGIVDLHGQSTVRVSRGVDAGRLVPSCGTMFVVFRGPKVRDIIHSSKLSIKPYSSFRCSADRSVIAGVRKLNATEINIRLPLREIDIPRDPFTEFGLSPNGRYLAYWQKRDVLCVTVIGATAACTHVGDLSGGPYSVSDEGEVLFGQAGRLAYWRPGQPSPTKLQEDGVHPQWVSPRAASALLSWSAAHGYPRWPAPKSGAPLYAAGERALRLPLAP